eukprot:3748269-Prymnesium_polylepis.2
MAAGCKPCSRIARPRARRCHHHGYDLLTVCVALCPGKDEDELDVVLLPPRVLFRRMRIAPRYRATAKPRSGAGQH